MIMKYNKMFFASKILGYIYYLKMFKNEKEQKIFHYNNFDFDFLFKAMILKERFYSDLVSIIVMLIENF